MSGLLGRKIGMTSMFSEDGNSIPVTVIEAGPCKVTQIKTKEKDGYVAIQVGFDLKKAKKVNKAQKTYLDKNNLDYPKFVSEFRNVEIDGINIGDELKVDSFKEGDIVDVIGTSKGKGFQGVMRRHNFGGVGTATHGQHNRLRAPGSMGASSYPSRVFKGQRMAGRMGSDRVTVQNLKVIKVMPEKNVILIKGCVPGSINSIVKIIK